MSSGFDRLEKFFSSSRKKDKASRGKAEAFRKTTSIYVPPPGPDANDASFFPSPSFLKPTSTRMQPRDPLYEREEEEEEVQIVKDKARSQSLPDVKKSIQAQCSAFDSIEVERKTRSYESNRPPSILDLPSTPELSVFRFPEDSLFRSPETPTTSTNTSPRHVLKEDASLTTPKQKLPENNLLDWSPRHLSLMFNPSELSSMNEQLGLSLADDPQEPMILMSSPIFTTPEKPRSKSPPRMNRPTTASSTHSQVSTGAQEWKFSPFPKQYSVISSATCRPFSPPASDSDGEYLTAVSSHSNRTGRYDKSSIYSVDSSPESLPRARRTQGELGRETWGARRQDPKLSDTESNKGSPVPRSRLKKSRSATTLTTGTSKNENEHILFEPTINDIYALSDEDIFEATSTPPAPQSPPPPPPKDNPPVKTHRRKPTPWPSHSRYPSISSRNSGQVTPPETPIEPNFMVPMPPNHSAGELGAILAAGIAKNYNFDLMYLVSLWPSGGGSNLEASLHATPEWPQRSTAPGGSIYANPGSKITGRYLAAFGLDQVGEPFQIHTKVLFKALRTEGWNEYEDTTVPFSHGYACSFNSDYVPSENQGLEANASNLTGNQGIVFVAYTRQHNESAVPREPDKKEEFLDRVRADVGRLADMLIKNF